RSTVIDRRRWHVVIDRPIDKLRPFDHAWPLRPLRPPRPLPVVRPSSGGRALLRHTPTHVERGLDGEAFLVLPADLAPAPIASAGVHQAAAGNLGDDLAAGAGRGTQIDG